MWAPPATVAAWAALGLAAVAFVGVIAVGSDPAARGAFGQRRGVEGLDGLHDILATPGGPDEPHAHARAQASAPATEGPAGALAEPPRPPIEHFEPEAPPRSAYECRLPEVSIPKARACGSTDAYPACRWRLPLGREVRGMYAMWRNTSEERWWGRPGLVGVLLATAREFARLHPEQPLAIGDLDAPGPRHTTHDRGVDVDLYLPGAMVHENQGSAGYTRNYPDGEARHVEALRFRVEQLARVLATCTDGQLRIYYNDQVVQQRFHSWFRERGYSSPFGEPMQTHNDLHLFHFHVTLPEDAAVPPATLRSPDLREDAPGG